MSLPPLATESPTSMAITTPAERAHHLILAMVALGQLERDLQRLSRALAPSGAPIQPRSGPRVVRWPSVRRDVGGYPAL
jgi:hypothetical protein